MIQRNPTTFDFQNTEGHQVEVGDAKKTGFFPQAKVGFWSNEVNFSMRLLGFGVGSHSFSSGGVRWVGANADCLFVESGSDFEFQTILKTKPPTNKILYSVEAKSLHFDKQHDDNSEPLAEGEYWHFRPDNVINSYVASHISKINNNYGTGQAFILYRPEFIDANGVSVWGDQDLSEVSKILAKTMPTDFWNNAVYPVTIK